MSIYKIFDVMVVLFPFIGITHAKKRPALVLSSYASFNAKIDHSIFARITSSVHVQCPLDAPIEDLYSCGLEKPSVIRLKLFTLDHRLNYGKIGILGPKDQAKLSKKIASALDELLMVGI